MPKEPTSVELETVAIAALSRELRYWRENHLPSILFDEDVALEVLVGEGIRPSRLGVDLEHLIHKAMRYDVKRMFS